MAVQRLPNQWDGLEDGTHEVPMHEYLGWPAVSASVLSEVRIRTPQYVRWCLDNKGSNDSSAAKTLGTVTHAAVLEPDTFEERFAILPKPDPEKHRTAKGERSDNPGNTAAYKQDVAAFRAANPGKELVDAGDYFAAIQMRDAIHAHPRARQLLRAPGPVELSAIVTDPETGVRCKLRPDKLVPKIGAHVNLKTTKNARWDRFCMDVFTFGYFRDMAFYGLLLPEIMEYRKPIILAVESDGPKQVAVHEIGDATIDAGERLVRKYLRRIAECFERDVWPGLPDEICRLDLPHHAWLRVDEEEGEEVMQHVD